MVPVAQGSPLLQVCKQVFACWLLLQFCLMCLARRCRCGCCHHAGSFGSVTPTSTRISWSKGCMPSSQRQQ